MYTHTRTHARTHMNIFNRCAVVKMYQKLFAILYTNIHKTGVI